MKINSTLYWLGASANATAATRTRKTAHLCVCMPNYIYKFFNISYFHCQGRHISVMRHNIHNSQFTISTLACHDHEYVHRTHHFEMTKLFTLNVRL